jgi:isoamylase
MFRMGDEFLQTQRGNNNPFNQDNETTWLDWKRLPQHREVFRFVSRMIAFRKAHPSLSRSRFWREDIHWYGPERVVDMSYESRTLAWCLHGESVVDDDIYVMVNSSPNPIRFGIYEGVSGVWKRIIDTSLPSPHDICDAMDASPESKASYLVRGDLSWCWCDRGEMANDSTPLTARYSHRKGQTPFRVFATALLIG